MKADGLAVLSGVLEDELGWPFRGRLPLSGDVHVRPQKHRACCGGPETYTASCGGRGWPHEPCRPVRGRGDCLPDHRVGVAVGGALARVPKGTAEGVTLVSQGVGFHSTTHTKARTRSMTKRFLAWFVRWYEGVEHDERSRQHKGQGITPGLCAATLRI